jgi:hypothetical protein
MEDLTYNHKLNEVLHYLSLRTKPPKATISEVTKALVAGLNSNESELLLLLDKLVKDGYVDAYNAPMNRILSDTKSYTHDVRYYIINIDGKSFFNEKGGYGKEKFDPDILSIMSSYKLNQVLGDLLNNPILEKKPDLTKKSKQNKISAKHKQPIAMRIRSISLAEWGIIWTIIAGIIALWVYVINPLIERWQK